MRESCQQRWFLLPSRLANSQPAPVVRKALQLCLQDNWPHNRRVFSVRQSGLVKRQLQILWCSGAERAGGVNFSLVSLYLTAQMLQWNVDAVHLQNHRCALFCIFLHFILSRDMKPESSRRPMLETTANKPSDFTTGTTVTLETRHFQAKRGLFLPWSEAQDVTRLHNELDYTQKWTNYHCSILCNRTII